MTLDSFKSFDVAADGLPVLLGWDEGRRLWRASDAECAAVTEEFATAHAPGGSIRETFVREAKHPAWAGTDALVHWMRLCDGTVTRLRAAIPELLSRGLPRRELHDLAEVRRCA